MSNATANATSNTAGTNASSTSNPILDALKKLFGGITGNK
jgi:hypothetical protein